MANFNHSWCRFYMELADILVPYQNDRQTLIKKTRTALDGLDVKIPPLAKEGEREDIDPFSFFALFNRGLKNATRFSMMQAIKEEFSIDAEVPDSVEGIPVTMMWKSRFFDLDRMQADDINHLWDLFVAAIKLANHEDASARSVFADCYNTARTQHEINWNITMGLYWIRPFRYLNMDSRNRIYMHYEKYTPAEIAAMVKKLDKGKPPLADEYLELVDMCRSAFDDPAYAWRSFPELSEMAWIQTLENSKRWGHMEEPTEEELAGAGLSGYYPPTDKYDPGLTSEDYEQVLLKMKQERPGWLDTLYYLDEIGGEASCKQLALKYGGHAGHYNNHGTNAAQYVFKQTNCPLYQDKNEKDRYWPVLFLGRDTTDEPGAFIWRLREPLRTAVKKLKEEGELEMSATEREYSYSKNMILQGPPGTGKTYHTVLYAVAVIEGTPIEDISSEAFEDVKARYEQYRADGQIGFTTFHQSYGYEEFVEGIRPVLDPDGETDTDVKYEIKPGVFKAFCENAGTSIVRNEAGLDYGFRKNPVVWKVSLAGTGDNPVRDECMKNGHIRIGWDQYGADLADKELSEGKYILNAFVNTMQVGDIVLSCYTASTIDAIGVVTGDYEWDDSYEEYKRVRSVEWLVKGLNYDIREMNNGTAMTLSTVYRLSVSLEDVLHILKEIKGDYINGYVDKDTRHVFIIDEINRGNISKIFGELITLIEPTKRRGQPEEVQLVLPYSQKPFTVPDNVYLIGTMNTADRSIALLDTALRRRFKFVEMMPDATLLSGVDVDGIDIERMLKVINQRIEILYDREHTIGHSFFLPLRDDPTMENLSQIFRYDILPLLQEYFFDDYEKIRLVLGDNQKDDEDQFIQEDKSTVQSDLFGDADLPEVESRYCINQDAFERASAYQHIYSKQVNG